MKRNHPRVNARFLENIFVASSLQSSPTSSNGDRGGEQCNFARLKRDTRASSGQTLYKHRRISKDAVPDALLTTEKVKPTFKLANEPKQKLEPVPTPSLTNVTNDVDVDLSDLLKGTKVNTNPKQPARSETQDTDAWGIPLLKSSPKLYINKEDCTVFVEGISLYPHQRNMRNRMRAMERERHRNLDGVILGAKMGLGKTVTVTSMAASDKLNRPEWILADTRPPDPHAMVYSTATLVICPLSLIRIWIREAQKMHGSYLKILVLRKEYLGEERFALCKANEPLSKTLLSLKELQEADLVITSFETVSSVAKAMGVANRMPPSIATSTSGKKPKRLDKIRPAEFARQIRGFHTAGSALLLQTQWHRIVADESQRLVNPKSILYESMSLLMSRYRHCLTGTPYLNYDSDLWAQFAWLGYSDTPRKRDWNEERFRKHEMHKGIIVMDFDSPEVKEFVKMPPRRIVTETIQLQGEERWLYLLLHKLGRTQLAKKRQHALIILNFLRQVCIAPFLLTPYASHVLVGKTPKEMEKKIEKCKKDPQFHSFVERERKEGKVSALMVALSNVCDRATLVAETRSIMIACKEATAQNGEQMALARLEHMERWISDVDGTAGILSAKVSRITERIHKYTGEGEKVIIFSSYVRALSLIRRSLKKLGIVKGIAWMEGETSEPERDRQTEMFCHHPNCQVLFMTYKVGSAGLTLIQSTKVVFSEPKWNDVDEEQGFARLWRIGQTRAVLGWSPIIENSIEERMKQLCATKAEKGERMVGSARGNEQVSKGDLETLLAAMEEGEE